MPEISTDRLKTIRSLLDLAADDGATPDERERAAERAATMMAKYAVDESMLDAARDAATNPLEFTRIEVANPYRTPKRQLLVQIAPALNCVPVFGPDDADVYGRRADLERLNMLYTSLLMQAVSLAMRLSGGGAGVTRSIRGNYLLGFAIRIGERMQEGRREATADAGAGAQLILANQFGEVERMARERHPDARGSRKPRPTHGDALVAGYDAAGRADLGETRIGPTRRAIGG